MFSGFATAAAAQDAAVVLMAGPFETRMAVVADQVLRSHRTIVWQRTCADAIRCSAERRIDLILTARVLDDGDWTALLSGLARLRRRPPVVVLSADASRHFRRAAIRLGAAACIALGRVRG